MSVSSVAGASTAASLQKQYQADVKALAADQAAQASQQVLALDQARIVQDAVALAALTTQQTQAKTSAARANSPTLATTASIAAAVAKSPTKVDLYL